MPYKLLIDSHVHLTSEQYSDEAIHAMLQKAKVSGLAAMINICTSLSTLNRALSLHDPLVFHAAAITPHDVHESGLEAYFQALIHALEKDRLVAVGETGLDLVNAVGPLEQQIEWFKRHIDLAIRYNKPLIVHCREAFPQLFHALDEMSFKGSVLFHCFTGTQEEAEEIVRRGYFLSLSGILTFKKSEALREIAKKLPLHQLMIETDSPYLAPQTKRGQINEPANVAEVADVLREIRGEEIEKALFDNTMNFFSLKL